ncbi:uncharacterized protein TNCV_507851 [Trichonephila clavipes]|nr:uncharacterized protein TNCV_507851 [Trichonephila clavipes]
MMEAGWSARRVDCVVRRCCNLWIREIAFTRRPGSGRPRQTSRLEDHLIVRNVRVQPTASLAAITRAHHLGTRCPFVFSNHMMVPG